MNPNVKLDRFRDKIAVVTGGAQGIGRATVERMALEGGKVFIVDRAEDAARATAKALRADGLDVDVAIADMATWAGASKVIDDIVALRTSVRELTDEQENGLIEHLKRIIREGKGGPAVENLVKPLLVTERDIVRR
jgi:NAD(P)-dependent dehydrogenase (short-subunit alcohol dehydrogenase family)